MGWVCSWFSVKVTPGSLPAGQSSVLGEMPLEGTQMCSLWQLRNLILWLSGGGCGGTEWAVWFSGEGCRGPGRWARAAGLFLAAGPCLSPRRCLKEALGG